jgi:hypothetical protein
MKNWKSRLFGDTKVNFYGWLVAGLVVIGASAWLVIRALGAGALESPEGLVLLAIYLAILGNFCLALQSYHARVAQKLDADKDKPDETVA